MTTVPLGWLVVLLVGALLASFLFSGSETGIISANVLRVRHLKDEGRRGARYLARLLDHRDQTIVAVLVGNNLALVVATVACVTLLHVGFRAAAWPDLQAQRWAQVLTPLLLTPIILFGCEILPKSLFRARPITMTMSVAPLIEGFRWVCTPLTVALTAGTRAVVRTLLGTEAVTPPLVTREELLRLVAQGEQGGALEEDEHDMIQGIIDFGHRTADEVMVPRTQMAMVKDSATCGALYDLMAREGHSRIPIYRDHVDTVIGVVYARDLLGGMFEDTAPITPIIRPVMHVPESMPLDDLLREMRMKQRSVVLVVDEHGGTAGMLTLEDLIEEIVGEIQDEYDEDVVPEYRRLPDGSYLVAGRMSLADANTELDLHIPDPAVVETVGGYLVHLEGRIPAAGEILVANDLQFHVMAATDRAVQRVRISRVRSGEEPAV